jgi:hypothetical protein
MVSKTKISNTRVKSDWRVLVPRIFDLVGDGKGWLYNLSTSVDPYAVAMLKSVTGKVSTPGYWNKEGKAPQEDAHTDTDISGDGGPPTCWQCGAELVWPDEQQRGTCSRCRPATNLFGEETTA